MSENNRVVSRLITLQQAERMGISPKDFSHMGASCKGQSVMIYTHEGGAPIGEALLGYDADAGIIFVKQADIANKHIQTVFTEYVPVMRRFEHPATGLSFIVVEALYPRDIDLDEVEKCLKSEGLLSIKGNGCRKYNCRYYPLIRDDISFQCLTCLYFRPFDNYVIK